MGGPEQDHRSRGSFEGIHSTTMHQFLVATVAFIVLIGVMVIVHELGHFIVAKLCRVRVEAFSLGFGPRLFGVKYGGTDYKVCLLPLGGFVKMTGENPMETEPVNDPGAFTSHPRWQRMLIGVAGPAANFVLAFALMFIYFAWINEVPAVQVKSTTIEWVTPGSAAADAGFKAGDIIDRFDNVNHPDWEQVYEHLKLNANRMLRLRWTATVPRCRLPCMCPPPPRTTISIRATPDSCRNI